MLNFEDTWHQLSATLITPPVKPRENARNTVAALWQLALGRPISAEAADLQQCHPLTAAQEATFRAVLQRQLNGEPLAYITGRQQFFGVELLADRSALIPRCEMEVLPKAAIDLARSLSEQQRASRSGSGRGRQ